MGKENKPKKEKKEKAAKVDPGVSELSGKMDQMIAGLNTVGGALSKLVELQTADKAPAESEKKPDPAANRPFTPQLEDETYPQTYVPPKYRAIVDELLSAEFGVTVVDFEDRTDFQLNIIVPEKFSSVTKEDRAKGVQDVRSRMISRAMGENGVREWCSLIRQNLNKYYTQSGHASPFHNQ